MLNVVMLSVVILSVVMLSVAMLSVVAPFSGLTPSYKTSTKTFSMSKRSSFLFSVQSFVTLTLVACTINICTLAFKIAAL